VLARLTTTQNTRRGAIERTLGSSITGMFHDDFSPQGVTLVKSHWNWKFPWENPH
jgi:hypothetical protein